MSNFPDARTNFPNPKPRSNRRMKVEDDDMSSTPEIQRAQEWQAQNASWHTPSRSYDALWVVVLIVVLGAGWLYSEYGIEPSTTPGQVTKTAPVSSAPAPSGNATAPASPTTPTPPTTP